MQGGGPEDRFSGLSPSLRPPPLTTIRNLDQTEMCPYLAQTLLQSMAVGIKLMNRHS